MGTAHHLLAWLRDKAVAGIYYGNQWSDADFAAIAEAFDRLFQLLGWRS